MASVIAPDGTKVVVYNSVKGAINEYIAITWLMRQGYEVFRNASPVGRADLVAKNWDADEIIWVDVKSEGYDPDCFNGFSDMSQKQHEQSRKYASSGIKYLVVNDVGTCHWHGEERIERMPESDKYWTDPRSGQRFLHPRNQLSKKEWYFFATWMLKYYSQDLTQPQADILHSVIRCAKTKRGIENLEKVRRFLYRNITGIDPLPTPLNDNEPVNVAA